MKLTEFQKKMLDAIPEGYGGISAWALAEKINPEMWRNYSSHGGMVSSLTRASWKLVELELIVRLPAKDRWDQATYCKKESVT